MPGARAETGQARRVLRACLSPLGSVITPLSPSDPSAMPGEVWGSPLGAALTVRAGVSSCPAWASFASPINWGVDTAIKPQQEWELHNLEAREAAGEARPLPAGGAPRGRGLGSLVTGSPSQALLPLPAPPVQPWTCFKTPSALSPTGTSVSGTGLPRTGAPGAACVSATHSC